MENNWDNKYLLDIKEIDEQHKTFFDLWHKGFNQVDAKDHQQVAEIIDKLQEYIKVHFKYEEEMMANANYDDLSNHIQEHKFFIQRVDNLRQELSYNNPLLVEKTAMFMKKWFLGHIIQSDSKYKEAVLQHKQASNKQD